MGPLELGTTFSEPLELISSKSTEATLPREESGLMQVLVAVLVTRPGRLVWSSL